MHWNFVWDKTMIPSLPSTIILILRLLNTILSIVKCNICSGICDHTRAYELYIDSINTDAPMIGFECASYADFKVSNSVVSK